MIMELTRAYGKLIAIGGAEDREGEMRILEKFVELSGGASAKILILTVATDYPEESAKEMTKAFKRLKAKTVKAYDVSTREDAQSKRGIKLVSEATGLYFTGGDQIHITSLMGGSDLQKIMHERYEKDLVIAGTSAGAAMMGNSMILSGAGDENPRLRGVELGPGMDLIIGAIIDTHFSQRGRHGRLLAAVAHYPQDLGIGIDENTAMIVNKDHFEVMGEGAVTVIDGSDMVFTSAPDVGTGASLALSNVKVHVLPEGYKFSLKDRCMKEPKNPKAAAEKAAAAGQGGGQKSKNGGNKK
jgi:cyanophycinase